MKTHFEFTITNSLKALSLLCQQIGSLLDERGIAAKQNYLIMLALEEMISNTIKYGYDDATEHQIKVRLDFAEEIILTIEDDGHIFDPLQSEPDSLTTDIEERQIGGMGIHLTKSMTKSMSYARLSNLNRLTIVI